jgi:hypothetical protein
MLGDADSDYTIGFAYELAVPARERLTVAAGTFDALKLTQSARITGDVRVFTAPGQDWGAEGAGATLLRDLRVDETLMRTTMWLGSSSFQPLKIVVESPLDVDDVLSRLLTASTDAAWEKSPFARVGAEDIRWRINGGTTIEATKLVGETRFAPSYAMMLGNFISSMGGMTGIVVLSAGAYAALAGPSDGTATPAPVDAYRDEFSTYEEPGDFTF